MKTTVNLYSSEFHPKLQLLSLPLALSVWLILSLVLLGIYLFDYFKHDELKATLSKIEQEQKEQAIVLKSMQTEFASIKADEKLNQLVDEQQRNLVFRKQLLRDVLGQEDLKSKTFSTLMLDLANHHQTGVWLTHILIDGYDVKLAGSATESSLVPSWLSGLSATEYFKGQQFSEARLFRDAEQTLNFVISSEVQSNDSSKGGQAIE
ncbi:MAG: PilN domain-containing protein [Paraglaciecola sp.]|uniref:PilN domain-containing protein n=1 Tax=Paraglaciecola sp. TaxID=1920173 RepID=UPI00273F9067|nr:PilN domain-containing protein [Paraglaciecola sp.]MDP5031373.1 PilN domain-containing protein [Paraglaciecola sp.]MDP5039477.1 PilN domain-containing protein [Paraglaciecola sp.]MDP5133137.1 PilN domain-containing protein [Paraglaciecola sp.]